MWVGFWAACFFYLFVFSSEYGPHTHTISRRRYMQLYTQAIIVCNGEIYFTHNKIYGFLIVVVPSEN